MKGKPIRVAHVIGKLNAAGVEAVINNYYRNIDHRKYQFDFFVDSDGECEPLQEMIDLGARYYIVPPYQKLPQHVAALTKLFKDNQYMIVHSSLNTLAPISMYCAKRAGVPIRINHNHSTAGKGEVKKNFLKYSLRPFAKCFATNYAACSNYSGEWLFGKRMMNSGRVTIFNNAIELEKYRFNESIRAEARRSLGIEDRFIIGHVGRFEYQKNHAFLIDIFCEVYRRDKSAVLLLVGIGNLMDEVKAKVEELGLIDSVLFLGARKDVNQLYQAMDVFVLPSRYEGLPVVGVEAQAAGLCCLLSDQMTRETIIIHETEVISLESAPEVWAKKIIECKDKERRDTSEEIKRAGFDIRTEAHQLELYYDECLRQANNEMRA